MNDINWDEMKEKLSKAIKLEKNDEDLLIEIQVIEEGMEENKMVGDMLKGEEEMKRSLGQFLGNNEPLKCDIDIEQDEKKITMKFNNQEEWKQVHELLHEMFFGDFFKKMLEAMMGAFGGMFGQDNL